MIVGFRGVSRDSDGSRGIRWVFVSCSSGKQLNIKSTIVGFRGFYMFICYFIRWGAGIPINIKHVFMWCVNQESVET